MEERKRRAHLQLRLGYSSGALLPSSGKGCVGTQIQEFLPLVVGRPRGLVPRATSCAKWLSGGDRSVFAFPPQRDQLAFAVCLGDVFVLVRCEDVVDCSNGPRKSVFQSIPPVVRDWRDTMSLECGHELEDALAQILG